MPAMEAVGFIEKPFSLADLSRVVRGTLSTSFATVESGNRKNQAV